MGDKKEGRGFLLGPAVYCMDFLGLKQNPETQHDLVMILDIEIDDRP